MSLTKRVFLLLAAVACCGVAAVAQTVPPNTIFQLNGNAAQTVGYPACTYGSPCDYWNLLNGTGCNSATGCTGTGSSPGHSQVRTFLNGTASTDSFQGGGSKDFNDLTQWGYSASPTPNKDALNAGYGAAYIDQVTNDFILIFGANRASPNGDANIGVWFFQNNVTLNGAGGFNGVHVDGDIFAISAFTNGGGTSTISVYRWNHALCAGGGVKNPTPGQCSDTNLQLIANQTSGICTTSAYCAITNSGTTNSTWGGSLVSPLFFEGGVDLSSALRSIGINTLPCFSSFMEETRSSQSTSAVLKDFLVGGFPVCGMSVSKSCGIPTVNADHTAVVYPVSGVVTNTGVGTLYNVSVFDAPGTSVVYPTIPTAKLVTNNTAGSPNNGTSTLGAGETGTWSDSQTTTAASASDIAYAQGALSAGTTPNGSCPPGQAGCTQQANTVSSDSTATVTCNSAFSTTLGVSKSCGQPGPPAVPGVTLTVNSNVVGLSVNVSGTVCNNGISAVTGVQLTDTPSSGANQTKTIGSLAACTSALDANGLCTGTAGACANYTFSYVPTNVDDVIGGGTGPGRYDWKDLVTISAATADFGSLCKIGAQGCPTGPAACTGSYGCASATCPFCQGSGECTAQ